MVATLLLAVSIPLALGGVAGRALRKPGVDQEHHLKPYRELMAGLDRTMGEIQQKVWAESESIDWERMVPAPPPPPARDPTEDAEAPDGVSPHPPPPTPLFNLYLGGIVWKTGRHYAYINDRVVTSGEIIEGFRVVSIEPNRVTFAGPDGQTYTSDFDEQLRAAYPGFRQ